MRISKVESFPIRIPGHPYMGGHDERQSVKGVSAYSGHGHYRTIYPLNAETYLVKITTDDGIVGWGETQAAIVPHLVGKLVDELVAPHLIGADPFDRVVLRDRLYDQLRDRGHDAGFMVDAISACDIALWDIVGKAIGQPVYKLLGGSYRETIPCYVSGVPAETVEEQIDRINEWIEKGFTAFKISLGYGVRKDVLHVEKLRRAFGDAIEILIDAHWIYDLNEAIELGRSLEKLDVRFLECPLNFEEVENYAELCRALDLPIALGEELRTRYRFQERLARKAVDLAQPDIGRLGITEGQRVIALCHTYGIPVAPHIGSGLAQYTAAALHIAATSERLFLLEYQPTQIEVSDQYFSPSLCPKNGFYTLPQGPGLGVTPDEKRIAEHIIN